MPNHPDVAIPSFAVALGVSKGGRGMSHYNK